MVPWKVYTPKGFYLGSQPSRCHQPQMGIPKPEKMGSRKFLSSVRRRKIDRIQWWVYVSNPSKSGGDIARKLCARYCRSRQSKSTEMHHNSSYIQGIGTISMTHL